MQLSSYRHQLVGALLAVLVCLLVWIARNSRSLPGGFLANTELRLIDGRFLARKEFGKAAMRKMAEKVAIVAIDDAATQRFGRILPRSVHGQLVRRLKAAGAKAVIFDVLFIDPNRKNPAEDEAFAAACRAAGNVFLPFDDNSTQATPFREQQLLASRLSYNVSVPRTAQVVRIQPPVAPLFTSMRGGGHVATKADIDGKFRSAILLLEAGSVYPHAALDAVVQTEWHAKGSQARLRDGYLEIAGHRFGPLDSRPLVRSINKLGSDEDTTERSGTAWMLPLNFAGGREKMEQITIPYLSVLEGHADDRIRGRIVIIGETATGTPDLRSSPFDTREVFLGVQTNATLIANLLTNDFLQPVPASWNVLSLLLCGLGAAYLALALRPLWATVGTIALAVGFVIGSMMLFALHRQVLEMTSPLVALALNFTALSVYQLVGSDRQAREAASALRETQLVLGQMVDARLAQELTASPETRLSMQIGTRREVTVLFADVRGFTPWSEKQPPEEVKARLDEYFPAMCEICADDQDGFIDKFIGDALMVVWNAHKEHPDHAARAVRAALAMQSVLAVLNDGWRKQKQSEFRIGIGIASGSVVFGTFGSPRHKLQPTVLGDTVNLASRLEGLTKEFSPILISEATHEAIGDEFQTVALGSIPIRGKTATLKIHAVTGKNSRPQETA